MTERSPVRESRSVRLRDDEWDLAEIIALMSEERATSAGYGLRVALRTAADRIRRQGRGAELDQLMAQAAQRRAGRVR